MKKGKVQTRHYKIKKTRCKFSSFFAALRIKHFKVIKKKNGFIWFFFTHI